MNIDKEYTFYGTLYRCLWVVIGLFIASFLLRPDGDEFTNAVSDSLLLIIGVVLSVYFFAWYFAKRRALERRKAQVADYAKEHNLSRSPGSVPNANARPFKSLSVYDLKSVANYRSHNHIYTERWTYGDISYDVMRETKYGDYKAYTIHYAAMITKLPRTLPNVFFDSKKSRGRQFRFHFAKSQLHSLEGNFDKYFATYFPEQYTIDSMSFITPDVMHALIDASAYDIEIKGDMVSIFGSLGESKQQIPEMERLLGAIRQQLMDNIVTYRDERVPYDKGRQTVAPIALSLKKSKFWVYVSIATTILYLIGYMLVEIYD